ncbi:MAG: hypothetical protein AAGG11_23930 [Pseudomonadota bacterium]
MPTDVEILKNRFVTVQLTLLSIAVALILENLLSMLLDLEVWSWLVAAQAFEVGTSAISMWVGFALGISAVNKPPHLMDFLVHFMLLFSLSTAVYFISTGYLPGYFLASTVGSGSAALTLWMDHSTARRYGASGPVNTAKLLTLVAAFEGTLALLTLATDISHSWITALILPVILLQGSAAYRSIRQWQQVLGQASC